MRRLRIIIYYFGLTLGRVSFGEDMPEDVLRGYRNATKHNMKGVDHLDNELFALSTKGLLHDSNAEVLVVHAMGFYDPGAEGSAGQGHLGTHPAHVTCFMRDVDSRRYLNTLCRAVADSLRTCKRMSLAQP